MLSHTIFSDILFQLLLPLCLRLPHQQSTPLNMDLIRDSTFGRLLNKVSGDSLLSYRDQAAGYILPERYDLTSQLTHVWPLTPTPLAATPRLSDIEKSDNDFDAARLNKKLEQVFSLCLVEWKHEYSDNPRFALLLSHLATYLDTHSNQWSCL